MGVPFRTSYNLSTVIICLITGKSEEDKAVLSALAGIFEPIKLSYSPSSNNR